MADPTGGQPPPPAAPLQAAFLALLGVVEAHARARCRFVACLGRRDDHVAEAAGLAWLWSSRAARAGQGLSAAPFALAAVAARASLSGRRVAGGRRRAGALPPARGRAGAAAPACGRAADPGELLRADARAPVPEQPAFRCDFPAWMASLADRDRRVAATLAARGRTGAVAREAGPGPGRVSQMRRELRASWLAFTAAPGEAGAGR